MNQKGENTTITKFTTPSLGGGPRIIGIIRQSARIDEIHDRSKHRSRNRDKQKNEKRKQRREEKTKKRWWQVSKETNEACVHRSE